jgi:hypothetical protein
MPVRSTASLIEKLRRDENVSADDVRLLTEQLRQQRLGITPKEVNRSPSLSKTVIVRKDRDPLKPVQELLAGVIPPKPTPQLSASILELLLHAPDLPTFSNDIDLLLSNHCTLESSLRSLEHQVESIDYTIHSLYKP